MVEKRLDAKWSGFLMHLNTGQPKHLKTGKMDNILFSNVLVWYSNGRSSTHRPIVPIDRHFEIRIQKVWFSNSFGIRIPTALFYILIFFQVMAIPAIEMA